MALKYTMTFQKYEYFHNIDDPSPRKAVETGAPDGGGVGSSML